MLLGLFKEYITNFNKLKQKNSPTHLENIQSDLQKFHKNLKLKQNLEINEETKQKI